MADWPYLWDCTHRVLPQLKGRAPLSPLTRRLRCFEMLLLIASSSLLTSSPSNLLLSSVKYLLNAIDSVLTDLFRVIYHWLLMIVSVNCCFTILLTWSCNLCEPVRTHSTSSNWVPADWAYHKFVICVADRFKWCTLYTIPILWPIKYSKYDLDDPMLLLHDTSLKSSRYSSENGKVMSRFSSLLNTLLSCTKSTQSSLACKKLFQSSRRSQDCF